MDYQRHQLPQSYRPWRRRQGLVSARHRQNPSRSTQTTLRALVQLRPTLDTIDAEIDSLLRLSFAVLLRMIGASSPYVGSWYRLMPAKTGSSALPNLNQIA